MGTLYLVATPIGNLEDISPRALRVLKEVKLIAAEDTRHTKILLDHFQIKTPTTSYFEHNKINKLEAILDALSQGDVALVSDAGAPAINDPGYELVKAALSASFDVRPVPGPSAPISALAVSGLPTDSFLYLGYLPNKKNERKKSLEQISEQPYTLIFLESPHRLLDSLTDIQDTLGNRRICIAREMTKLYEEYFRGDIAQASAYFKSKEPRGEFTLVIEGKNTEDYRQWTEEELLKAIKKELKKDKPAKEISAELAEASGWNKKEIYNLIHKSKK